MKKILNFLFLFTFIFAFNVYAQDAVDKNSENIELFKTSKCASCHSIEKLGLEKKKNQKSPDLSTVGNERNAMVFLKYLLKEETLNDKKHLMKFNGSEEDLTKLSLFLESLKTEIAIEPSLDSLKVEVKQE